MGAKFVFYVALLKVLSPAITALIAWLIPSPAEIMRRRRERDNVTSALTLPPAASQSPKEP